MALPHALVLPFPGQGHVIPLMELSHHLVDHGFKITFVNTDFTHAQIAAAFAAEGTPAPCRINQVSLPDGLESGEAGDKDRTIVGKLTEGMQIAMPPHLLELIRSSKDAGDEITCMIADHGMAWALEISRNMGLRTALFGPASAAMLAISLSVPKLIEQGNIDANGFPMSGGTFQLGPGMLQTNWDCIPWKCFRGDRSAQSVFFNYLIDCARSTAAAAEFIICNSFIDSGCRRVHHLQTNWDCIPWKCFRGDRSAQSVFFNYLIDCARSTAAAAEFIICNSFIDSGCRRVHHLQTNWDCIPWKCFRGDRSAQSVFFNYLIDCARSTAAAAEFIICNSLLCSYCSNDESNV